LQRGHNVNAVSDISSREEPPSYQQCSTLIVSYFCLSVKNQSFPVLSVHLRSFCETLVAANVSLSRAAVVVVRSQAVQMCLTCVSAWRETGLCLSRRSEQCEGEKNRCHHVHSFLTIATQKVYTINTGARFHCFSDN